MTNIRNDFDNATKMVAPDYFNGPPWNGDKITAVCKIESSVMHSLLTCNSTAYLLFSHIALQMKSTKEDGFLRTITADLSYLNDDKFLSKRIRNESKKYLVDCNLMIKVNDNRLCHLYYINPSAIRVLSYAQTNKYKLACNDNRLFKDINIK